MQWWMCVSQSHTSLLQTDVVLLMASTELLAVPWLDTVVDTSAADFRCCLIVRWVESGVMHDHGRTRVLRDAACLCRHVMNVCNPAGRN